MKVTEIAGLLAIGMAVVALVFALTAYGFDVLHRWHQAAVNRAVVAELRRHGVRMRDLPSWFHDVDHAATWMAIADDMARGYWPDVGRVRDAGIPHERSQLLQLREYPRKEAANA